MIKHALTAAAVASIMALTAPAFGASSPVPMEEIPTQSISSDVPLARIQKSIVAAAMQNNWTIVKNDLGHLQLRYSRGTWWVLVNVDYSEKNYTISYADSVNLGYGTKDGATVIHRNYNRWVRNLNKNIKTMLSLL